MSLFAIAFRSVQQRWFSSLLTMLSMGLGVMLVVAVLSIHGVVEQSFRTNSSLGYNVIIGAKGGQEQLVLNTVYYLSQPVENVRYDFYLEFFGKEQRDGEIVNSFAYQRHVAEQQTVAAAVAGELHGGLAAVGLEALRMAAETEAARPLEMGRDGRFSGYVEKVIPVCLGDYFGRFRVVGTTPAFFNDIVYDYENEKKYEFAQGRNFEHESQAHGFFEAVVGSTVAYELGVKLGDEISPRHGTPDGHTHERKFTVVGILKPSGKPNDRAVFVNMEGFYLMEDHAKPIEEPKNEDGTTAGNSTAETHLANQADRPEPLPAEQREVTAMLAIIPNALLAEGLKKPISKGTNAQLVFPVLVIHNLFSSFVDPVRWVLLGLTSMICIVSGLSILLSIYNSMSDRRQEIAVMRALGAGRDTVFAIILLESAFLALGGGLIGWLAGHLSCVALSGEVERRTGVIVGFWNYEPSIRIFELLGVTSEWASNFSLPLEIFIIPGLLLLAVAVGFMPALAAYKTDVAKSLGK
jgi:putative ABC transport system permease protein